MVRLAAESAFITAGTSRIGIGVARAFVAAGAKVAIADVDGSQLADVAEDLGRAGGTVAAVRLDPTDEASWSAAADAAEEALGPISILCNLADEAGRAAVDDEPFRVCRWTDGANTSRHLLATHTFLPRFLAHGIRPHVLNTASISGLVAMGLLVPGSVSTRVSYTPGVAAARLFGPQRNRRITEADHVVLGTGACPDQVGQQVVDALPGNEYLIATHREWQTSRSTAASFQLISA